MIKKTKPLQLIVLFSLIFTPLALHAKRGGPHGHRGFHHKGMWLKKAKEIGLSDGQVQKIEKIHFDMKRQMIPLEAKMKTARLNLHETLHSDRAPSERQILTLIDELNAISGEVRKHRIMMMLKVREVMNADQWRKARAIMAEHKHRMRKKFMRGDDDDAPAEDME